MKKTIKKADGSEEVIEGSAEELAEFEKRMKEGQIKEAPKGEPGLLLEKTLKDAMDEMMRLKRERDNKPLSGGILPDRLFSPIYHVKHSDWCQITVASRGWFSVTPPVCTCGAETQFYNPHIGYYIVTSNEGLVHSFRMD